MQRDLDDGSCVEMRRPWNCILLEYQIQKQALQKIASSKLPLKYPCEE